MTQIIHSTPNGFKLSTAVGAFVSWLKVNSYEEEKETASATFAGCTATIYVEEKCKIDEKGE